MTHVRRRYRIDWTLTEGWTIRDRWLEGADPASPVIVATCPDRAAAEREAAIRNEQAGSCRREHCTNGAYPGDLCNACAAPPDQDLIRKGVGGRDGPR